MTKELEGLARKARIYALTMIYHAGSGHPGGALSAMDLLCHLYFREMDYDPADPGRPDRDRFILSKGHACAGQYAVGCLAGCLPLAELGGFRKLGRKLQGHPHVGATPFVETSTGSLGQGFSVAVGTALGLRHRKIEARTYAMIGDGEIQEGEIWEGAMFAAHHRLHRLCVVLDYNKLQSDDLNRNIMGVEPVANKFRAFGWRVEEIDGHQFDAIEGAFGGFNRETGRPTLILAHTTKGKGVHYMEDRPHWHGSVKMTEDNLRQALTDLNCNPETIGKCRDGTIWEESLD
ncbi:MAG: transketolase [Acidobacteriota bacterium]|nr:transketolase [Acidobacteriota bacterium]